MLACGGGLAALVPSALSAAALALAFAGIELQVRAVEEPYLAKTHGAAYRAYASRVGRFLPGVGRLETAAGDAPGAGSRRRVA
jgi:protein-S-isoprenylcysteine O-methyltransferase Ste14